MGSTLHDSEESSSIDNFQQNTTLIPMDSIDEETISSEIDYKKIYMRYFHDIFQQNSVSLPVACATDKRISSVKSEKFYYDDYKCNTILIPVDSFIEEEVSSENKSNDDDDDDCKNKDFLKAIDSFLEEEFSFLEEEFSSLEEEFSSLEEEFSFKNKSMGSTLHDSEESSSTDNFQQNTTLIPMDSIAEKAISSEIDLVYGRFLNVCKQVFQQNSVSLPVACTTDKHISSEKSERSRFYYVGDYKCRFKYNSIIPVDSLIEKEISSENKSNDDDFCTTEDVLKAIDSLLEKELSSKNKSIDDYKPVPSPKLTSYVELQFLNISLNKGWHSRLGFSICDARKTLDDALNKVLPNVAEVKRVFLGTVADKDGRIRMGDRITEVNGESLLGKSAQEVIKIIRKTTGVIRMVLCRGANVDANGKCSHKLI